MIEAIVGLKGVGKTATILDQITTLSEDEENNIVCIEYGKRFDGRIPFRVRLVDIEEYPVQGYGELLAFIAGIIAKDFDISHIFVDSVYKVAKEAGLEGLEEFMTRLDELSKKWDVKVIVSISEDPNNLPESIAGYVKYHE